MPPPLAQSKYFEHNCIFVKDILYQNVMFVQGGEGCQKAPKPMKGLSSIICNVSSLWKYTVYVHVCSTYLNDQTICSNLTGIHIGVYVTKHIDILSFCFERLHN